MVPLICTAGKRVMSFVLKDSKVAPPSNSKIFCKEKYVTLVKYPQDKKKCPKKYTLINSEECSI